jgi:UDP-3-O-[3-hydroxymyristoyl] N-acetylglucosamine deacetylase
MRKQYTINEAKSYTGVGLHSGKEVTMVVKPAPEDTGIMFVRTDLPGRPCVPAKVTQVSETRRATTLGFEKAKIHTAEHLLAALSSQGITNLLIEMDSAEPPVADGSALPFIQLIEDAELVEQNNTQRVIKVTEPLWVRDGDRYLVALPYDGYRISCLFVNSHPLIGTQYGDFEVTREIFREAIAPARTIGFMHEVEALQAQGLALGGSLENAVVYDHERLLTPLRFTDELVRHKILDIVGDLSLIGPIEAHIIAAKSSHALNTELARRIHERYFAE